MTEFLIGSILTTTVWAYLSPDVKDKPRQGAKQVLTWLDRPGPGDEQA